MPELTVSIAKSQICSALGVSEPHLSHTFRPTNLDIEALPFARLRGNSGDGAANSSRPAELLRLRSPRKVGTGDMSPA